MDIASTVSEEYVEFSPDTPVSKLVGTFDDPTVRGVVVHGGEFEGIVTRRQLVTSHRQPHEKIGPLVWHVPQLTPDEDVRKVAGLVIDSDAQFLPVFDEGELTGVVTADDILETVEPFLDAATVGAALHVFRDHRITVRATDRGQGGDVDGTDSFGGDTAGRGGFGAREGKSRPTVRPQDIDRRGPYCEHGQSGDVRTLRGQCRGVAVAARSR